jgi:hypothetical protein
VDFTGPVGAYNADTVGGIDISAASLDSHSINATTLGTLDALDIYVSASDITALSGVLHFLSGFTVNLLSPGWTVTESTYLNNSNAVFGTSDLLATNVFTAIGADQSLDTRAVATPFSVTELFVVRSNGFPGSANNTIDLSGAVVPESSTWALMALGFAGLGFVRFRQKRQAPSNLA